MRAAAFSKWPCPIPKVASGLLCLTRSAVLLGWNVEHQNDEECLAWTPKHGPQNRR